jgi:hypothetical protein
LYQKAFDEEISKEMGERTILFSNADLSSVLYGHEQKMFKEIDSFPPSRVRDEDLETLCDYFEREYKIDVPVLDENRITVDHEDAKIDVRRMPNRFFYDGGSGSVSGTRFKFFVPYSGEKELFKCRPSSFNFNPPHAQVNPNELVLIYTGSGQQEATAIRGQFDRELGQIKQWLTCVGSDVEMFNTGVRSKARTRIEIRKKKLDNDLDLASGLGFPARAKM